MNFKRVEFEIFSLPTFCGSFASSWCREENALYSLGSFHIHQERQILLQQVMKVEANEGSFPSRRVGRKSFEGDIPSDNVILEDVVDLLGFVFLLTRF